MELHRNEGPLLLPNAYDRGSAGLLATLGFDALATTSSGAAATFGRLDGGLDRDESLDNASAIVMATDLPVSADLGNGFAADLDGVARTVSLAAAIGVAGVSIEDASGSDSSPIYEIQEAVDRITAAAEVAHGGGADVVLTARSENYLFGRLDLKDTIGRLQAYQDAGADVLFAPGLCSISDIQTLVASVDRPVNVLLVPDAPTVQELADAGVKRISVGGAFAFAAYGTMVDAATEFRDQGTATYLRLAAAGKDAVRRSFLR